MRRLAWLAILLSLAASAANSPAHAPAAASMAAARQAFFERSQLGAARAQAQAVLRANPHNLEALFLEMEAAALEADNAGALGAALRLCELPRWRQRDDRVAIAAARVLDMAANTPEFRAAVPRIRKLLTRRHTQSNWLRAALVAAAADGLPGLDLLQTAHEAGLLTDWRAAGPFGEYPNLDFDRRWAPEEDGLALPMSGARAVEKFRFEDGTFRLPGYFDRGGVFYAAAEVTTPAAGRWVLRAESAGTLDVFVDGVSALRKDDRPRATPEIAAAAVHMKAGRHRVLVKFLPSALPFRIALLPPGPGGETGVPGKIGYAPEAAYVAAEVQYWRGDYAGALAALRAARARHEFAAGDFLMYQAWNHADAGSPEAASLLDACLWLAPEALLADYELAAHAAASSHTEEALRRVRRVLDGRQDFAPAQHLLGEMAIRLHWPVRAVSAIEILLRLHPSCDTLLEAQHFFASHARFDQAHRITRELENCAPDSLSYLRTLSEQGEHGQAAEAAQALVTRHPLDRDARKWLARELALAGQGPAAAKAMRDLAALAPNSTRYREMAARAGRDPNTLLDDETTRTAQFAMGEPFYSALRRDGIAMARQTAERRFSGGPAVRILDDQAARLWPDGSVSLYVHKLTRVLDRGGVETYGEVALPRGAEVLELRTIKEDGGIAEPELAQPKATISMPGLLPGDAVDEEYVVHDPGGGIAAHPGAFRHTFGSFRAPVMYSRFAVITPRDDARRIEASNGAPSPTITQAALTTTHLWERNDIAQSAPETTSASGDLLPAVRLEPALPDGWDEVRRHDLNALVDAIRIGPRVEQAAAGVTGADDEARARGLYRKVVSSIRSASGTFDAAVPSAEETLAAGAGSRTAALLAIARAAGLKADLVLARNAGVVLAGQAPWPSLDVYTRPLVRFRFADKDVIADAETEGLAFGALPPSVERHDALLVSPDRGRRDGSALLQLPDSAVADQSVARGEVTLDTEGNLSAQLTIVLGAWRGAQMRSILGGIEPAQRGQFYQQLAARIFPGAEDVSGTARNERDPDHPLELAIRCRVPRFVNFARGAVEIDQLAPALGLKKMYGGGGARRFPLYLDTPLIEITTFRLHLPPGVEVTHTAGDLDLASEFGRYQASFRQIEPGLLEIRRAFQIPVQIVPPDRYAEFAKFTGQIDELERQRLTLEREPGPDTGR
jgi:hypothetical protein